MGRLSFKHNFVDKCYPVVDWIDDATDGIRIWIGYKRSRRSMYDVTFGDRNVHGLLVQRDADTTLHTLLDSLMLKYSPEDVTIDFLTTDVNGYVLDDFAGTYRNLDKVTVAKNAEDIISFLKHITNNISTRCKAFDDMGALKLSDARKAIIKDFNTGHANVTTWSQLYKSDEGRTLVKKEADLRDISFSRHLVVFHEFSKVYQDWYMTPAESDTAMKQINLILKLARSAGYHMLFVDNFGCLGVITDSLLSMISTRIVGRTLPENSKKLIGSVMASQLTDDVSVCIDEAAGTSPKDVVSCDLFELDKSYQRDIFAKLEEASNKFYNIRQ